MVVTQDKPLAAVFRQVGRSFILVKRLNGARHLFPGDPAGTFD